MPFQFKLASVLRVREYLVKQEERALERIQLAILRNSHQIEQAESSMAEARCSWQLALRSTTVAADLNSMLEHEGSFASVRRSSIEVMEKLKASRDEQLKRYYTVHQEYESLLNVRNERRAEYEQQQARNEQKTVDDVFGARRPAR